jgi:iron complex transport system ATP-binding protein
MFADRIVMLRAGRVAADGPVVQTITDAMLQRVFDVAGAVSRIPPAGIPFVLPHGIGASKERVRG